MAGKTGTIVLIVNKNKEMSEATEELIEKLRQMSRDVIVVKADETVFPNVAFSAEQAAAILKDVSDSIKKRLN